MSFDDVRRLDINSNFCGVDTKTLMENAGKAIYRFIKEKYGKNKKILVVCGPGNNGGDGLVAARLLSHEDNVRVFLFKEPKTEEATYAYTRLTSETKVPVYKENLEDLLNWAELIIDAIFGVGISGNTVKEPYRSAILAINSSQKDVISIDYPSGIVHDVIINPTYVVTFHDVKEGLTYVSRNIRVADIGIPEEADLYAGPGDLFVYYPRPHETVHKGRRGRVLIIDASTFLGAIILAAMSAYRMGVDLVYVYTYFKSEEKLRRTIYISYSPSIIVVNDLHTFYDRANAVLIGPGMDREIGFFDIIKPLVETIIENPQKPIILDAGGLTLVKAYENELQGADMILTPHAGEFRYLFGYDPGKTLEEKIKNVKKEAKDLNATIVLKGPIDIISDGKRIKLNRTGCPSMAVGGSGDVLSGVITALRAKINDSFKAAYMGTFITGLTGEFVEKDLGYGILPEDIINQLPKTLKTILEDPMSIKKPIKK